MRQKGLTRLHPALHPSPLMLLVLLVVVVDRVTAGGGEGEGNSDGATEGAADGKDKPRTTDKRKKERKTIFQVEQSDTIQRQTSQGKIHTLPFYASMLVSVSPISVSSSMQPLHQHHQMVPRAAQWLPSTSTSRSASPGCVCRPLRRLHVGHRPHQRPTETRKLVRRATERRMASQSRCAASRLWRVPRLMLRASMALTDR